MNTNKIVNRPIRVLITDDSPSARELLKAILESSPDLDVIGVAKNGLQAVQLAKQLAPDIVTMDIYMPEMDGYQATRQIMEEIPRPIIMITASFDKGETDLTFKAIQAGALSVLSKPSMNAPPETFDFLISQVKLMSEVKVIRRWRRSATKKTTHSRLLSTDYQTSVPPSHQGVEVIGIASSTGGPGALATILGALPANFSRPILVVQHITKGFGLSLVSWLNSQIKLPVKLGQHGGKIRDGQVIIAPDDYHMTVDNRKRIILSKTSPYQGTRPSANYLFSTLAKVYGNKAVGIILTGMGSDGAKGMLAMQQVGAQTIAQNEASCVVFGMPAAAINLKAVEQVLPLTTIPLALMSIR
ncbi:MAG: hypothetical protein B6242_03535 [Anaerolineaceae bacterium 4572_78]|nr:MAG: hypothetical protein B6242_03535 [Anaerolineaceae bacterium 4572_78]